MREINAAGLRLVKQWEGILDGDPSTVNLDPYLDPVGIWTIGWGHAIVDPGTGKFLRGAAAGARARALYPGGITTAQASDLLRGDLLDAARDVASLSKVALTDNQFSALTSFEFNTGGLLILDAATKRMVPSTLLRRLNKGDYAGAAAQFAVWNKGRVDGKLVVLPGLVKRRAAEAELFNTA